MRTTTAQVLATLSLAPALACGGGTAPPPPPTPPPPTYSVSGTVTGSTVAGVRVLLLSNPVTAPVFTDGNGRYTVTGVPSGAWLVQLSAFDTTFSPPPPVFADATGHAATGVDFVASPWRLLGGQRRLGRAAPPGAVRLL